MSLGPQVRLNPSLSKSGSSPPPPPPAYSRARPSVKEKEAPESIRPLNLSDNAGPETSTTSTKDECIAHLKLLAAFADLRDTIGKSDGLFGISDREVEKSKTNEANETNEIAALLSEKRWAIYVTRAVERFTVWWQKCVPTCGVDGLESSSLTVKDVEQGKILAEAPDCMVKITWTRDTMPPLGSSLFCRLPSFCLS